jgi:predicted  nucleic acid-binding Zn ribbon protein
MQTTKDIQKCSRCKKTYNIINFGSKKNGEIYRTCVKCRHKQSLNDIVTDIPNENIKIMKIMKYIK